MDERAVCDESMGLTRAAAGAHTMWYAENFW